MKVCCFLLVLTTHANQDFSNIEAAAQNAPETNTSDNELSANGLSEHGLADNGYAENGLPGGEPWTEDNPGSLPSEKTEEKIVTVEKKV